MQHAIKEREVISADCQIK